MLRWTLRLLPLVLLLGLFALGYYRKPGPAPVCVLKEGVFEITPDRPFILSDVIERGKTNAQYEITIEVKVRYGNHVTVTTSTKLDDGPEAENPRLSERMHHKQIKLTDLIRESARSSTVVYITIPTSGTSSEAYIKVTKQLK